MTGYDFAHELRRWLNDVLLPYASLGMVAWVVLGCAAMIKDCSTTQDAERVRCLEQQLKVCTKESK